VHHNPDGEPLGSEVEHLIWKRPRPPVRNSPEVHHNPDGEPLGSEVEHLLRPLPRPPVRNSPESANQDLQNRLLNLESANLMQELQSINNKCIAKIGFVDNKYEYLMDRTLTLQSDVVTTQTQCKEERLSLIDKIRSLESCVSEEHNRWYDSMKNLESQAREEVHSLEQTLCARLQALEETLCKNDKEPNKQKGSISNLLGIMGIPKDGLQNLANTLEGDKDLNSPRELSPEAEKELALVEKTIREAHVDRVNPELKCILVILPYRHSPTGILMQREDVILEWIFLPRKPNKKLKTYIEKISDLIHKVEYCSFGVCGELCWDFDGDCNESVDCFWNMIYFREISMSTEKKGKAAGVGSWNARMSGVEGEVDNNIKLKPSQSPESTTSSQCLMYSRSIPRSIVDMYSPSIPTSTVDMYSPSIPRSVVDMYSPSIPRSIVDMYSPSIPTSTVDMYSPSIPRSTVDMYSPSIPRSTVDMYSPSIPTSTVDMYSPSIPRSIVDMYSPSIPRSIVDMYSPSIPRSIVDMYSSSIPRSKVDMYNPNTPRSIVDM
ncbi:hypothetical protein STEG23_031659, partial [Scotinomys teguina]